MIIHLLTVMLKCEALSSLKTIRPITCITSESAVGLSRWVSKRSKITLDKCVWDVNGLYDWKFQFIVTFEPGHKQKSSH